MIAGGGGDGGAGGGGHSITCGGGGGFSHSTHIVHGTWSFATDEIDKEVAFVLAENASMKISKKGNRVAIIIFEQEAK